jgi:hypothetical protein
VDALQRLKAQAANPESRRLAQAALAAEVPGDVQTSQELQEMRESVRNLRVLPAGTVVPEDLRQIVLRGRSCAGAQVCVLMFGPEPNRAVLVSVARCPPTVCGTAVEAYYLNGAQWSVDPHPSPPDAQRQARDARIEAALRQGRVEVREVPRRQVFVDGQPVGDAFE